MQLNIAELKKQLEQFKIPVEEKHERIELNIPPNSYAIVTVVKHKATRILKLDHWSCTFNLNSFYEFYRANELVYYSTEPPQEDMDHAKLYDFMFAPFFTFKIINLDPSNTQKYILDFLVYEY